MRGVKMETNQVPIVLEYTTFNPWMESGKYAATVVSVGQFLSIFQKTNNENLQPNEKSSFLKILKTMFDG